MSALMYSPPRKRQSEFQQERRILELMEQRDALSTRTRAAEAVYATPAPARRDDNEPSLQDTLKTVEGRLVRERAHSAALEEKVAILTQASYRLSQDLNAEIGRCRTLESEVAALEAVIGTASVETDTPGARPICLHGRTFLYVGGRPRLVATPRRFAVVAC